MLQAWWNPDTTTRRSIALVSSVAGLAMVAVGIAASPVSAFGDGDSRAVATILLGAAGPIFGAATGGYVSHRDSDLQRALVWAVGFAATAGLILVAMFGLAAILHPTVRGVPGLGEVWYGTIVGGLLVAYAGVFLRNRDTGGGRLAALGLLGLWLLGGWVISAASGDWGAAAQDYPLSATGAAFVSFAVGRPISHESAPKQVT